MINSTLGAFFGGTTRGAHQGVECNASFLITPPNLGSGGGSCVPVIVVVAPGDPGVPLTCCASVWLVASNAPTMAPMNTVLCVLIGHSRSEVSCRSAILSGSRDQLDSRRAGDRVEPDVRRFARRFHDGEDRAVKIGANVAVQVLFARPLLEQQQGVLVLVIPVHVAADTAHSGSRRAT